MAIWSVSGKLLYVTIKNSSVILSIHNTIAKANFAISDWNHVAITCEESKIKVFVNGTEILTKEQWNEFFFLSSDHLETENVIGNHPVLFKLPLVNKPFVGALMDLHVIETALSANQISDLSKGNLKGLDDRTTRRQRKRRSARAQMMLLGLQISYIPPKSHVIVLVI